MIDGGPKRLGKARRCALLGLSRSSVYHRPRSAKTDDLALMRLLMESGFCVEALQEALARYGKPEIFNTDQGSQFTGDAFTGVLEASGVRISMDVKGCCHDNIFIERLWRTVKYEYLYLHAFNGGQDLRDGLRSWVEWYNRQRPHQGLGYKTPDEVYYAGQEQHALVA